MWKYTRDLVWDIIVVWGSTALFFIIIIEGIYYYHQHQTKGMVVTSVLDSGLSGEKEKFDGKTLYPFNFVNWNRNVHDESGHGSNITSIIHDISPTTYIMPVKATSGEENDVWGPTAFGVFYSVLRGADVVNMSFSQEPNPLLDWAIQYGKWKGVVFVAAAGNEGVNEVRSPANIEGVISVASIDDEFRLYGYSNVGENTVFAAPGLHVKTSHLPSNKKKGETAYQSGTSFSAGYISGVASYLLEQDQSLTQKEIEEYLYALSTGVSSDGLRSSDRLRSVQFEKIQAVEQDTPYLAFRPEKTIINTDSLTLYIDSHKTESVRLFTRPSDTHMEEIKVNESEEKMVQVPLAEGYNKIQGFVHEDTNSVLEEIVVLKDTTPPLLEYHGIQKTDKGDKHALLIEDYSTSDIEIDGKRYEFGWESLSLYFVKQEMTEQRWLYIPVNEKEHNIEVTDEAGNISRYIIPAPTL